MDPLEAEAAFTEVWHADAPRVLGYARRHVPTDLAHDVVAETFAIAWRRWDDVPRPPLPWLIATARNLMRAQRRDLARDRRLDERLALLRSVAHPAEDTADEALLRAEALRALAVLGEDDRELLLLVAWDGLGPEEAAAVLGVRPGAFRTRLHRARRALARAQEAAAEPCERVVRRAAALTMEEHA